MPKVHQKKGQVVQNVNRGDLVVEFDAIEQARLAVEQANVTQMQIAMAPPDLARRLSRGSRRNAARGQRESACRNAAKGSSSICRKQLLVAKPASLMSSTPPCSAPLQA